ncbi:hypothetical protein KSF_099590 [Reticulibacter mediterranei]|uniref:non-specific serine/threonine protein kinase n=1 Tax=Reticulibacter mediterranei TaxID=2778369 RepID=A0A8J3ISD4_9CHLR|nr:serine/threonine-protein kinase [Reticulibacter mediterranei]GHO99911.1 hypothetical protein KSF_099590 [Reticulibacter mediterranei]
MVQDLTGQMVGHYRIIKPIEQGGMATVYQARDVHLQREVAVKIFQLQKDQKHTQEFFYRFTREAQVVARLDHPNILLVHDYGEQDSLAYLVMPYLAKGSLKNLLKKRGRLPIPEALRLIFQLLDALHYAHGQGLIHRDIKPGNILFKNDQTPVLADFGLVKEIVTGNTEEMTAIGQFAIDRQFPLSNGHIMGTPYYMAPEQIQGKVQPQSDIYSIGLVLYEMLTGQLPFSAETQAGPFNILLKQIYEPPRPMAELNPGIPPQLAEAVMRVLEKDVRQRYQSAADFSQALRAAAQLNISSRPASEGSLQINETAYISDLNVTRPMRPSELQSLAALPTVEHQHIPMQASNHFERSQNSTVSTDPTIQRASERSHHTPRRQRRSYPLYSVLATIVLMPLLFAGITHFTGLGFASTLLPTVHSNNNNSNNHVATTVKTQPTRSAATLQMPPTQTSCPSTGTARAAVMAPYLSQGHNALVYAVSFQDIQGTGKRSGTLMRYDSVTGKASPIITVPNMLTNVQVSGDGQWVIFSAYGGDPEQIQMVRIDGKGLQTLYCTSSSAGLGRILASPGLDSERDWRLFFTDGSTMNVLNIPTGKIEQKFSSHHSYRPLMWPNDRNLYLLERGTSNQSGLDGQSSLVSLDTYDPIPASDPRFLGEMSVSTFCSDLDIGPDLQTIFTSQCKGYAEGDHNADGGPPNQGPSTVNRIQQDTTNTSGWSKPTAIFTSSTLAVLQVRAVTSSTLLLLVGNGDQYSHQNGLWKINTDGSGLQRLSIEMSDRTMFNHCSQYPWSNVARDGSMYAFKTGSTQALGYDKLFVGSLNGGQPTAIAEDGVGTIKSDSQLEVAGWTTI